MNNKTYLITYKSGLQKRATGTLVFFSSISTNVPTKLQSGIYLNAEEVLSVEEIETKKVCDTNGPNE